MQISAPAANRFSAAAPRVASSDAAQGAAADLTKLAVAQDAAKATASAGAALGQVTGELTGVLVNITA